MIYLVFLCVTEQFAEMNKDLLCDMIRGAGRGEQTPPLYDNENL